VRKPDAYPHCRQSDDDVGPTMTHRRAERTACGDHKHNCMGPQSAPQLQTVLIARLIGSYPVVVLTCQKAPA
jgi:hypothetical protein